jgi:hypothetical protein
MDDLIQQMIARRDHHQDIADRLNAAIGALQDTATAACPDPTPAARGFPLPKQVLGDLGAAATPDHTTLPKLKKGRRWRWCPGCAEHVAAGYSQKTCKECKAILRSPQPTDA